MGRTIRICLTGLLVGIGVAGLAQNTNSGDIRGTVTDPSGAVIPGVTVTVLDVDKGDTHIFVTDGAGLYDTNSIVPDRYQLTFTKQGFTTYVRGPITLQVGAVTVDAQLKVGAATQKVTVSADLPLLQTESSEQSTTLSSETMQKLPNVSANWTNFMVLLPGASGANGSNAGGTSNPGTGVSINGGMPYYSNFLADGASTTLPQSSNFQNATFETVAELQVNTSTFSAEYGVGGAAFNQISKGGTNTWHGSAYEYFQNDAMNARNYFSPTVPFLRYNEFGGSVGGPILRNRTFFYFNYDKVLNESATFGYNTVPTAAMMQGNFTGMPPIYDPSTLTQNPDGSYSRSQFQDNQIPQGDIQKVALAIQQYFQPANVPGTPASGYPGEVSNNHYYSYTAPAPVSHLFGRLDYDLTSKNRLTFSITEINAVTSGKSAISNCPVGCTNSDVVNYLTQISDVWTISPSLVNEFRFGYTRQGNWFVPQTLNGGYPGKVGLQYAKADLFPDTFISGSCCGNLTAGTAATLVENADDLSDVVTLVKGKHVLHFGGELLAYQEADTTWGNVQAGEFTFTGVFTQQSPKSSGTGAAYADFLLGQEQTWSANNFPEDGPRAKKPALFIQDDYKVRPDLTLNLGLRYQIQEGWGEAHNRLGSFDPSLMNAATSTPGAMWFAPANGRTTLQKSKYDLLLPRIGFAWAPQANLTVRGGFGIYAYPWGCDVYCAGLGFGSNSYGSISSTNGLTPVATWDEADPGLPYLAVSHSSTAYNGQTVNYNVYDLPVPTMYQWSLSVQRQIGPTMMVQGSYVASAGRHLSFPVDVNQVPESKLSVNDQGSRPYPQFQSILADPSNANSSYNSLQLVAEKRLSAGFSFSVNYTWSHMLDTQDSSGFGTTGSGGGASRGGLQIYQNAFDPAANYASSNFDVRNMFKGYGVYQLPFGRGRRFLNDNMFLDEALGGWQATATFVAQTGNPFTPTISGPNNSYSQGLNSYWLPNVVSSPTPKNRSIKQWYDPAAFSLPAAATYGDAGRNSLRAPGLSELNGSLGKTFAIPFESVHLEIRGDANNVLNHASFSAPDTNVNDPGAGVITSTTSKARILQLSARFSF
ncbi:TonB-dependent receptor [Paracidobacterium acidisoli]|uniref:Carboxypeptidase regulatory-like domain-containing protein n=1 Tax=Paracidobacterium acidisoli TaxID=2303751 RepID=A0A372IJJ3_9BACT|nr:carboxypeptidase regulatory-like domain-containing protein [Paracidobacterium acidisoli]MBT9332975.1 carboxypeptidase regulatory-like domain-containing protein [Paracidobacterium acidisoli]